jgi:hypothetical protein
LIEDVDFLGIHIEAQDAVADFRQAGSRYQAYITRANYSNFHYVSPVEKLKDACRSHHSRRSLPRRRALRGLAGQVVSNVGSLRDSSIEGRMAPSKEPLAAAIDAAHAEGDA